MNYLDSIQRREAIDEDKKIHKRALDSEFAFIKRIGEDTLPISKLDKRAIFNISKMIEDCAIELDGVALDVNSFVEELATWRPDQGEYTGKKTLSIGLGKVVKYWNILVSYIKNFLNSNTLSPKEVEDIWNLIDERIGKNIYDIQSMINYLDFDSNLPEDIEVDFPERNEFNQLYDYLEYKNLSPIQTSTSEGFIRRPLTTSFETPEQAEFNRQEAERQQALNARQTIEKYRRGLIPKLQERVAQKRHPLFGNLTDLTYTGDENQFINTNLPHFTDDQIRDGYYYYKYLRDEALAKNDISKARQEQHRIDLLMPRLDDIFSRPENIYPEPEEIHPVGLGKNKRKSKKKMDSDEFELNIEINNKNMDKKQLNQMKKALKKMPLPFDDGDDSNYLK